MTVYDLRMTVHYDFDRPTGSGRQLFRVMPADVAGVQRVTQFEVAIHPEPVEQLSFADFFGTQVIEAAMPPGLTELKLTLTAVVERKASEDGLDFTPARAALADEIDAYEGIGADAPHHFVLASPRIPGDAAISEFSRAACAGAVTVQETVAQLGEAIHAAMTFDAEATEVDTPPAEAFAARRGVCQDFAQIMIGGLRALGVPAAYAAGYLRTEPPPGMKRLEGADAMHAWVRAWTGTRMGWVEYDPTNRCFVGGDHLIVGYGRDYSDVAPVTGIMRVDGGQSGSHHVDIIERTGAARTPG